MTTIANDLFVRGNMQMAKLGLFVICMSHFSAFTNSLPEFNERAVVFMGKLKAKQG